MVAISASPAGESGVFYAAGFATIRRGYQTESGVVRARVAGFVRIRRPSEPSLFPTCIHGRRKRDGV
jgi:hypothetical protein